MESPDGFDRRIQAVLAKLARTTGGEAVAALAALERLLPPSTDLADVIFTGLHHLRQTTVDPSLVTELRRVTGQVEDAVKRQKGAELRVRYLESVLRDNATALREVARDLDEARQRFSERTYRPVPPGGIFGP